MTTAISIRNLSKQYVIRHEAREPYTTIRDVLTRKVRSLSGKFSGKGTATQSEKEVFWAIDDLSFDVKQGDRVGIIGRNGAGKSTLLKILSRIVEPSKGSIRIQGRVSSLLEVGTGFHPELTGRENIFLNGAILGMTRADILKKFDEIVAFAEIEKFLDTPVKHYSSGMYVRLAFSVAAHMEPDILVLDEVLAVGDSQFQRKCLDKVEEVGATGRTILFVSHNMGLINALCNTAVFLEKGKLAAAGPVAEVLTEYQHRAISALGCQFEGGIPSDKAKAGLLSARVCGPDGKPSPTLFVNEASSIQVQWQLNIAVPYMRFGIEVVDSSGVVVMASMDTDSTELFGRPRTPGKYASTMKMPPYMFLPGSYAVKMFAGMPGIGRIMESGEVLQFEVIDNFTHLSHVAGEKRPGFMAMPLEWEVGAI